MLQEHYEVEFFLNKNILDLLEYLSIKIATQTMLELTVKSFTMFQ